MRAGLTDVDCRANSDIPRILGSYWDKGLGGARLAVGTEVKGERSTGAKRQPLERMTKPDAIKIRGPACLPVN